MGVCGGAASRASLRGRQYAPQAESSRPPVPTRHCCTAAPLLLLLLLLLLPLLQLDVRLTARDARWHCRRAFQLGPLGPGGAVELFFIDTTPLLSEYRDVPWRKNRGGWVGG